MSSYRCTHCQTRTWNLEESTKHLTKKHRWDYFPLGKKLCSTEKFLTYKWHRLFKAISRINFFMIPVIWLFWNMGWNSLMMGTQAVMCLLMLGFITIGHPFLMHGCPCCSRVYWKDAEMVRE